MFLIEALDLALKPRSVLRQFENLQVILTFDLLMASTRPLFICAALLLTVHILAPDINVAASEATEKPGVMSKIGNVLKTVYNNVKSFFNSLFMAKTLKEKKLIAQKNVAALKADREKEKAELESYIRVLEKNIPAEDAYEEALKNNEDEATLEKTLKAYQNAISNVRTKEGEVKTWYEKALKAAQMAAAVAGGDTNYLGYRDDNHKTDIDLKISDKLQHDFDKHSHGDKAQTEHGSTGSNTVYWVTAVVILGLIFLGLLAYVSCAEGHQIGLDAKQQKAKVNSSPNRSTASKTNSVKNAHDVSSTKTNTNDLKNDK